MFANPHVTFGMLLLCYAQCPNYLLHIVFSFPSTNLQHYVEFDSCTTAMLEKLLGTGSFGITMDHLAYHQVTLPTSSGGFGLPLMVRLVAFAFVGCLVLIVVALIIRF